MSVLKNLLSKENDRNQKMISAYTEELEKLPRGSIKEKRVGDKIYYYLVYREGNKVITKYVGKSESSLTQLKEMLLRRKQVEDILKKLRQEQLQIKKLEAVL